LTFFRLETIFEKILSGLIMLKDKIIDELEKILSGDELKIEQGRAYAVLEKISTIPLLVKLALQEKFKILPLGNGSKISLSGYPGDQTLFLKLSRLSRIKKVVPQDLFVMVEPGFNLKDLNPQLSDYNLFCPFSLDKAEGTIGGAVASGITGKALRKDISISELVLALEIVDSYGQILKLGAEVFKSVTGYDTARLLVGSWGALGVITSVSLRIFPLNRKKEFVGLKLLPAIPGKLKNNQSAKAKLNQRIKNLLDPQGVFVE
jgi:glycolate oxidase FAD binding subunit